MVKFISNYTAFNLWANNKIINWLQALDVELLYKITPSSFDSIDGTLQHVLRTQKFWTAFITEQDIENFNWSLRPGEAHKILEELNLSSLQMKEKFSSYRESELEQILNLNRSWGKNSLSRYEYIVHAINHSTFHRGQIVTMARCIGISNGIPETDYNFFNRN